MKIDLFLLERYIWDTWEWYSLPQCVRTSYIYIHILPLTVMRTEGTPI